MEKIWPGLRDLLNSEKGIGFVVLAALATLLLYQGHVTSDQWMVAVPGGYGVYAATKTVASGMAAKAAASVQVAQAPKRETVLVTKTIPAPLPPVDP